MILIIITYRVSGLYMFDDFKYNFSLPLRLFSLLFLFTDFYLFAVFLLVVGFVLYKLIDYFYLLVKIDLWTILPNIYFYNYILTLLTIADIVDNY